MLEAGAVFGSGLSSGQIDHIVMQVYQADTPQQVLEKHIQAEELYAFPFLRAYAPASLRAAIDWLQREHTAWRAARFIVDDAALERHGLVEDRISLAATFNQQPHA